MTSSTRNPLGAVGTISVGVSTKMYLSHQASLRWLAEVRSVVDARPGLGGDSAVRVSVIKLSPTGTGAEGLFVGRFAHDAGNLGRVLDEALERAAMPAKPARDDLGV